MVGARGTFRKEGREGLRGVGNSPGYSGPGGDSGLAPSTPPVSRASLSSGLCLQRGLPAPFPSYIRLTRASEPPSHPTPSPGPPVTPVGPGPGGRLPPVLRIRQVSRGRGTRPRQARSGGRWPSASQPLGAGARVQGSGPRGRCAVSGTGFAHFPFFPARDLASSPPPNPGNVTRGPRSVPGAIPTAHRPGPSGTGGVRQWHFQGLPRGLGGGRLAARAPFSWVGVTPGGHSVCHRGGSPARARREK